MSPDDAGHLPNVYQAPMQTASLRSAPGAGQMHVLGLQSGPTVPAMGAFYAEKGNLIGIVEAYKGHRIPGP